MPSLGSLASLPEEAFEKAKKDPMAGLSRMARKNRDKWEAIQWLIEYGQLNGAVQKASDGRGCVEGRGMCWS